jgi:hypothetical protein
VAILVASLSDSAQFLSDKRNDASIGASDWVTLANWAVKSLWRLGSSVDPDWYFDHQDFSLAGGFGTGAALDLTTLTGTGSTPHLWRALHGLDYMPDTTSRRTVPRRNFQERNQGRIGRWLPTTLCIDRAYDIRGALLTITPEEIANGPYRVYYRYAPYLFSGPSDTNPLDPELEPYDQLIVETMCARALGVEESDMGAANETLAQLRKEFLDEHSRDDESPCVMADVEGNDEWGFRY